MDFIKALWRGDIPLVKTFWIFAVLVFFFVRLPLIIADVYELYSTPLMVDIGVVYTLFALVYWALVSVAVWRAATKYTGSIWWAGLAKYYIFGVAVITISEAVKQFQGLE